MSGCAGARWYVVGTGSRLAAWDRPLVRASADACPTDLMTDRFVGEITGEEDIRWPGPATDHLPPPTYNQFRLPTSDFRLPTSEGTK
jgi:hypothetical protein